jgi:HSP20 family molecular chaperone IbpA
MQEKQKVQIIPVKVYRSADRITVAAPLLGLQPEDILVTVTEEGNLVIRGEHVGLAGHLQMRGTRMSIVPVPVPEAGYLLMPEL